MSGNSNPVWRMWVRMTFGPTGGTGQDVESGTPTWLRYLLTAFTVVLASAAVVLVLAIAVGLVRFLIR